jgi:hypothetical protein
VSDKIDLLLTFGGIAFAVTPYWLYIFAGFPFEPAILWAVCVVGAYIIIGQHPDD